MNKLLSSRWLRAISLLMAATIAAVVIVYPRLIAHDASEVPHGFLAILLMGMSGAWVHGFGFVPEHRVLRIIFGPLVAWPVVLVGLWGVFFR